MNKSQTTLRKIGAIILFVMVLFFGYGCTQKTAKGAIAKGIKYCKMLKFDNAIEEFSYAISINPNDAEAYNRRGLAYAAKHNLNQAISDLSKAIEINPGYAIAYRNRAIQYFIQREFDKSWADVHKAEALGDKWEPKFLEELKKASGRDK